MRITKKDLEKVLRDLKHKLGLGSRQKVVVEPLDLSQIPSGVPPTARTLSTRVTLKLLKVHTYPVCVQYTLRQFTTFMVLLTCRYLSVVHLCYI